MLLALAAPALAEPQLQDFELCQGALTAEGPRLANCRPLADRIDPQGRLIWVRARVIAAPPPTSGPSLIIAGAASSQVWFNGAPVGANGVPGASAEAERPGRYAASIPLPAALWRAGPNEVVLRMSSFHGGMTFHHPVTALWIGEHPSQNRLGVAATFAAAGALLAAAFGFAGIHAVRRTQASRLLAALAAIAALQAGVENLRWLWNHPYPLHVWRVGAILLLAAAFSLLLVEFAATRFWPQRRRALRAAAVLGVGACALLPGFDVKSMAALGVGALLAAVAAGFGVWAKRPGARPALAYLAAFLALPFAAPAWFLDVSFFILAATLTLPLLVVEVLRLGRQDEAREAALTRAAVLPDRLSVATGRGVDVVPAPDIVSIGGADDYAELRLRGGRTLLHAARLDHLEASLPESFLRVHRSAIANLALARSLSRDGSGWRLELTEGPSLPVARSRLKAVRERLAGPQPGALRRAG